MNTSMLRTLAKLSLSAALSPVGLMAQAPINVTVPFDFTVGPKLYVALVWHQHQPLYRLRVHERESHRHPRNRSTPRESY
jgi:hypothetical protein